MALSPIALFQSNENSLAQILAGGNQTVSGIMDRAIQIGRDISNKQLSQEKDLIQMRQQQTAFDQRRAETAQQDYEDTRQFARGAFESDRTYGLQARQEERASAKDLFNMRDDATRTGIAQGEFGLRKSQFELDKSKAETQAEQRRRVDAYFSTQYGGNSAEAAPTVAPVITPQGPSATSPGAIARQVATDPASLLNPKPVAAPVAETPAAAVPITQAKTVETDIEKLFGLESKLEFDLKNVPEGHPAASEIAQQLGKVKGQIASIPKPSTTRARTPESIESEKLLLKSRQRGERDAVIEETLKFSAPAFDNDSGGDTVALMQLAGEKGKKPEDVLFSEDFNTRFGDQADAVRARIIAAQKNSQERELAAISSSSSAEEYVEKKTGITEAQKQERRRLYRAVKGEESAEAAATPAVNPWIAVP